jgi:phosphopantetheine--protein transferase-like protein
LSSLTAGAFETAAVTSLSELDVDIWYRNTTLVDQDAVETAKRHLSIEERNRCDRFYFQDDRRDFAVAHDLLRRALSSYVSLSPSDWRFTIDTYGKPSIDSNDPQLRRLSFSLSHTRGFVACVVTKDVPVGIDVERIDQSLLVQEIADRYFAAEEAQQLQDCPSDLRPTRFTELWTLKEAFLKAVGTGHSGSPTGVSFRLDDLRHIEFSASSIDSAQDWQFALFEPLSDVRMSIAIAGSSPPRYFFHPYNGCVFDSLPAMPCKQSMVPPNRGLPL